MSYRDMFEQFQHEMRKRDKAGRLEYGDKSYSREPEDLVREICEELVDVANWAAILHAKLQQVQKAVSCLGGIERAFVNRAELIADLAVHYKAMVSTLRGSKDEQAS